MSLFHDNALLGSSGSGTGAFNIDRSLRFNSGDSAYLSRTTSSAGNRQTFTLSWWMKRCDVTGTANQRIFGKATGTCLLYTSPSPRDATLSRMPSSA